MNENLMGREYTPAEWAAARRQGIAGTPDKDWHLIFGTGRDWPTEAREKYKSALRDARDWALIANAMDREWQKPLPEPTP